MFISDMMEGKLTSSPLLMQKASAQPIIGHARTQRASIACYTASPSNRHAQLQDITSSLRRYNLKTSSTGLYFPKPDSHLQNYQIAMCHVLHVMQAGSACGYSACVSVVHPACNR